ncbi:AAA family ATPase [Bacillus wiedmannii]|nr:AAA family ATPase [Bacillus wiedmannii]MED3126819.1 AAA family ATPase [Bacillus wiedmannii]
MRLHSIYIEKYKQLRNFKMQFKNVEYSIGKEPFRFLIGKNGSGKTSLLEAIGLIFTRILQDETPGFKFEIIYMMNVEGCNTTVTVMSNKKRPLLKGYKIKKAVDDISRLSVYIAKENEKPYKLDLRKRPFSQCVEYHPSRIIAYASGPTNIFEDVLLNSPEESIKSDIYDAREGAKKETDYDMQLYEIDQSLRNLQRLYEDASYLNIDGSTSKFVMFALNTITPTAEIKNLVNQKDSYINLRKMLLDMIGGIEPVGVSIVVDEMKLKLLQSAEFSTNMGMLVEWLSIDEELPEGTSPSHSWCITRKKGNKDITLSSEELERIAYFEIVGQEKDDYHCPGFGVDINPFDLLAMLLVAKREGLLLDIHLFFKHKELGGLFNESALSDGEYLWLGRMGLILLSRENTKDNMLFLLDEPDVHLNESWNERFVELIHKLSNRENGRIPNEFIIATHSTLLLTDADPDQLYLLEKYAGLGPKITPLAISTFAANRAEISKRIFGTNFQIGQYAMRLIEEKFNQNNKGELEKLLQKVGPGYYRYRLYNKLQEIELSEKGEGKDLTSDD